jgi:biotin operon repressor
MNERFPHDEIRNMDEGGWYWIPKALIQEYTPKAGAMGIAVYNFLASMADRNQSCFPSQQYIADRLGCSRPTVNKALKRLQDHGLIRKETRNRYHCVYRLLQVRCNAGETQVSTAGNSDEAQGDTNNTKLTRITNNTVVGVSQKKPTAELRPQTKEELLATDIAQTLASPDRIHLYRSFARRYPESFLREVLSQVKQTPDRQIKKSRAALFAYLVKQNDHRTA